MRNFKFSALAQLCDLYLSKFSSDFKLYKFSLLTEPVDNIYGYCYSFQNSNAVSIIFFLKKLDSVCMYFKRTCF